jgi:SAM-dependent methyltransferase
MFDYNSYWEKCWIEDDSDELYGFLKGYYKLNSKEIELFKESGVHTVCDAACGFGAYSLALASNGFDTYSFDISEKAVAITKNGLEKYGIDLNKIKIASILDTGYEDDFFDGVVAHAVIDHLLSSDAKAALSELFRITKKGGLIWLSFDIPEDDDMTAPHFCPEEGTIQYTGEGREGMLFHPYDWDSVNDLLSGSEIIYKADKGTRERVVIIRK